MSLASRGSVLGKAVLGLGLGFFCVLGLGLERCVGIRLTPSVVIIFFLATLFFL